MALYFDDSNYKGDYESSVISFIEEAIESWESENESPDNLYELIKELCKTLLTASSNPVEAESLIELWSRTSEQVPMCDDYDGPDFDEMLEGELAKASVGMIPSAAINLWDLFAVLTQIQKARIPEIPLRYLKHVFRCYIWGLKQECIILCRSVIEVAIDDKITDKMCADFCDPNKPNYTLADKIKTIERSALLDKELVEILRRIKCRGDKCVHGEMDVVKDVMGTVKDTCKALIVISELDL
jgi:hypothetical protein